jgi:chromosomal replication initiation ATPase DnaA
MATDTIVPRRPSFHMQMRVLEKRVAYLENQLGNLQEGRLRVTIARSLRIKELVAKEFYLQAETLDARTNVASVVVPRHIAMYLMYTDEGMSYPQIARAFVGRHHTTVMHAVKKIHTERQIDTKLDALIQRLQKNIADEEIA